MPERTRPSSIQTGPDTDGLGCAHEKDPDPAQPRRTARIRGQEDQVVLSGAVWSDDQSLVLFCSDTAWARYGDDLRTAAPRLEVVTLTGTDIVGETDLARLDVAFFSGDVWPERTPAFMSACLQAPRLRWLHTFSAGVDHPVFGMFVQRGTRLTTSSGSSARPIAQAVILMILELSRGAAAWMRAQQDHVWAPHTGEEIEGANIAILGMGPIGHETATLATALGMNAIGCRRSISGNEPCETRTFSALDELLGWADYVVLALPLTADTHHIIGPEQLAMMKPTARLINVGRGDLIDEPALIAALADGRLAGAGLDVFSVEPLPADSPLWDMPNVLITPHDSSSTELAHHRAAQIFIDNLGRFANGEAMRNEMRATDVGMPPAAG